MFVSDCSDYLVHNQFARLPPKMDAPEKVLSQAHGQANRVVDFLHENGIIYWLVLTLHYLLKHMHHFPPSYRETKERCVLTMNS